METRNERKSGLLITGIEDVEPESVSITRVETSESNDVLVLSGNMVEIELDENGEAVPPAIYDAEGVRVKVGDEFNMIEEHDQRSRRFGIVDGIDARGVRVRWIRWADGPEVLSAERFEEWCRIYVDERKAEPEPVTWNVGDGATAIGWTDTYAGTIIEAGPRRVVWQEDKATLLNRDELTVTPGGFAAHWEGVQRYSYERNPNGRRTVYTLRKNGRWIEKGAPLRSSARIVPGRCKHHDYNF
jgi:hypothetical protein